MGGDALVALSQSLIRPEIADHPLRQESQHPVPYSLHVHRPTGLLATPAVPRAWGRILKVVVTASSFVKFACNYICYIKTDRASVLSDSQSAKQCQTQTATSIPHSVSIANTAPTATIVCTLSPIDSSCNLALADIDLATKGTSCTQCTNCNDCRNCKGCTNCNNCQNCKDCTNCVNCSGLTGATNQYNVRA